MNDRAMIICQKYKRLHILVYTHTERERNSFFVLFSFFCLFKGKYTHTQRDTIITGLRKDYTDLTNTQREKEREKVQCFLFQRKRDILH